MAKLYESDYEAALIHYFEASGWQWTHGESIELHGGDGLLTDTLTEYLRRRYPALDEEDLGQVVSRLRHVGGATHFDRLRETYRLLRDGFTYKRHRDGASFSIDYLDYDDVGQNSFRVINQLHIPYGSRGDERIPDVLLYVNGIPLCIIELKNPTDYSATIAKAYDQIHIRYMRDIPHLLRYCPLSCISDATTNNSRLGTTYTPYEHYYAWKKVDNLDPAAKKGLEQLQTLVRGALSPERLLEILRDYIYFPDSDKYDREQEIVCRYPQFFATRLLRDSVLRAYHDKSPKGGTYFGATGCGKTYTMMFLARQLSLRCPELGSPTVVMLVDREDLQSQAGKLFTRSEDFLSLGVAREIESRADLAQEMTTRKSGGYFICTVQKFCEETGLLSSRRNLICFSDEAHRTQTRLGGQMQIRDQKTVDRDGGKLGAFVTRPYAELLREAFPNATFVGFTGTPIDETVQVFGEIVACYTMRESVEDGITVGIKYIPRIAKVTLDKAKVNEIEAYYSQCADEGSTDEEIQASMQAMSRMEVILGDDQRLEQLAKDIIHHYTTSCECKPDVAQKAMIVSSNRKIGYKLLQKFRKLKPDWFEERKSPDDSRLTKEELRTLPPMPTIAMVATRSANDDPEMYHYLGNEDRIRQLDDAFKMERSNFRIVIVVDMWITGFDVPCLTYLYNDKPLRKHTLIQTISRVNRIYPGKDFGYVIDYIGIYDNLRKALKDFEGDDFGPSEDDVEAAHGILQEELEKIGFLFAGFDLTPFTDEAVDPVRRLTCLSDAAEHILMNGGKIIYGTPEMVKEEVTVQTLFLSYVRALRAAYAICQPSGVLSREEYSLAQAYMAVAAYLGKSSGEGPDVESMNRHVQEMVSEALKCSKVVSILDADVEEEIFGDDFIEHLREVKQPKTKMELLVKILRQAIQAYKKTNKVEAKRYEERLNETLERYHNRPASLASSLDLVHETTGELLSILEDLGESRKGFSLLGLTEEEKVYYDIVMQVKRSHGLDYGEDKQVGSMLVINDKCKVLAQHIREVLDRYATSPGWFDNQNTRAYISRDLGLCIYNLGLPIDLILEVSRQVLDQAPSVHHLPTISPSWDYSVDSSYPDRLVAEGREPHYGD